MSIYTYSIFDSNPNTSSGTVWPDHDDVEIEADSDADALEEVDSIMASAAKGLNAEDGYDVGQTIYSLVWSEDETIIGSPEYDLTAEDLGVEDVSADKEPAFNFSADALSAIDETGCDPESDLRALTTGEHTPESLLEHCLDGADEDRAEGWRDYVDAVVAARAVLGR